MSRTDRRIEQIKARIPITRLLADYGYQVQGSGGDQDREQQFSCDLHGDGHDNKPSARAYPDTNIWFCFACSAARDAIETVKAKERIGFMEAIAFLEAKYALPVVAFEDGDETRILGLADELFSTPETFEAAYKGYVGQLESITEDHLLPLAVVASHWEALDHLVYLLNQQQVTEKKAREIILGMQHKLKQTFDKTGVGC